MSVNWTFAEILWPCFSLYRIGEQAYPTWTWPEASPRELYKVEGGGKRYVWWESWRLSLFLSIFQSDLTVVLQINWRMLWRRRTLTLPRRRKRLQTRLGLQKRSWLLSTNLKKKTLIWKPLLTWPTKKSLDRRMPIWSWTTKLVNWQEKRMTWSFIWED